MRQTCHDRSSIGLFKAMAFSFVFRTQPAKRPSDVFDDWIQNAAGLAASDRAARVRPRRAAAGRFLDAARNNADGNYSNERCADWPISEVLTVKTICSPLANGIRLMLAGAVVTLALSGTALAQAPAPADPNPGAITFTGNFDVLPKTAYVFRGITQEADPKLTMWPSGDIGIALFSGEGGLKAVTVNFGVWNSLHTGSSGLDNSVNKLHYEEDFYATLGFGFKGNTTFSVNYTAYTSPNGLFGTTHEVGFKVAVANKFAPYVLLAQEMSGGADAGPNKGTYVELGAAPSWPLAEGKATVAIPIKLGLSAKDYYENPITGEDSKFGYLDIGVLFTVPLSGVPSNYGAWNFHVGGDFFTFGETNKVFNAGDKYKGVFLFGIGVSY
jgi:hypothetical protein